MQCQNMVTQFPVLFWSLSITEGCLYCDSVCLTVCVWKYNATFCEIFSWTWSYLQSFVLFRCTQWLQYSNLSHHQVCWPVALWGTHLTIVIIRMTPSLYWSTVIVAAYSQWLKCCCKMDIKHMIIRVLLDNIQ